MRQEDRTGDSPRTEQDRPRAAVPTKRRPAPGWLRSATGLSLKLGAASAVVVSLVIGVGAFLSYRAERQQLLEGMTRAASAQGRLVLTGLKAAMLENNRTLLLDLLEEYGRTDNVERIYLVDATGGVALTTQHSWIGESIDLPEDVCPTCPLSPDAEPTRTNIVDFEGERIMRSLMLVRNEPRCHRCHPSEQAVLGGLGVDFSMAALAATRAAIVSRTLRWGVAICVLVLLAVGAVVQFGALHRLRKLRDLARSLPDAMGVPSRIAGRDEIGELARSFESVSFNLQRSMAEIDFQRQFLIDLIDRMDDAVAVFDNELQVVAANKSYLARVAGQDSSGGIEGLGCADAPSCLHEEGSLDCPTRRAFRTGLLEKGLHKKEDDGKTVCYEVFASPMTGESSKVTHVVEVWRDVTERVTLEASLAHSEQLATLGVLASGFSHEIATPLGTVATSIQGILRRLEGRDGLGEEDVRYLRERLDLAVGEVFRCRDVTRSLLDLARKRRTVAQRIDLSALAKRMMEVVRPTAEQKRVRLEYETRPGDISVLGHSDQLEQVALNLFMNAIEAMPDGGTLSVALSADNGQVSWTVSDTGCGLSERDRSRVFDPFFTKKAGGTGLGLYITNQLVRDHGGSIEIASSDARGTQLRIRLPADKATAQAQREQDDTIG